MVGSTFNLKDLDFQTDFWQQLSTANARRQPSQTQCTQMRFDKNWNGWQKDSHFCVTTVKEIFGNVAKI